MIGYQKIKLPEEAEEEQDESGFYFSSVKLRGVILFPHPVSNSIMENLHILLLFIKFFSQNIRTEIEPTEQNLVNQN